MKFRTEYTVHKAPFLLDPEKPVTLLGSCFALNIGAELRRRLWNAHINPAGTLFNPLSIERSLYVASVGHTERESIIADSAVERDGVLYSRLTDTSFHGNSMSQLTELLQRSFDAFAEALSLSDTVIVTLGTTFIYYWKATGEVVANCHKLPESEFERKRLDISNTTLSLISIVNRIRTFNPEARVIFTVSPVRHLRDGFAGNSRSKATLLLAVDRYLEKAALTGKGDITDYFPAFEILNDDLRDYRFYASDLVHPSSEAVEYILDIFLRTYLSDESRALLTEARNLSLRAAHRPLNPDAPGTAEFRRLTQQLITEFSAAHPGLLSPEIISQ